MGRRFYYFIIIAAAAVANALGCIKCMLRTRRVIVHRLVNAVHACCEFVESGRGINTTYVSHYYYRATHWHVSIFTFCCRFDRRIHLADGYNFNDVFLTHFFCLFFAFSMLFPFVLIFV